MTQWVMVQSKKERETETETETEPERETKRKIESERERDRERISFGSIPGPPMAFSGLQACSRYIDTHAGKIFTIKRLFSLLGFFRQDFFV